MAEIKTLTFGSCCKLCLSLLNVLARVFDEANLTYLLILIVFEGSCKRLIKTLYLVVQTLELVVKSVYSPIVICSRRWSHQE